MWSTKHCDTGCGAIYIFFTVRGIAAVTRSVALEGSQFYLTILKVSMSNADSSSILSFVPPC